jgi:membrane protein implicated in regulation of membrane protease activity
VTGSTTLAMALLAGPSAQGAWCGVLGMPDFGTEAASRLGIDLGRLVLVPTPGTQWLTVAAAMTDVLSVVVARSPARVAPAETSRLGARLRQRGSTLVVLGDWPGADATLTVVGNSWRGLGAGHGYLSTRRLEVEVGGRNGMHQTRRRQVTFPLEAWAASEFGEFGAGDRLAAVAPEIAG